MREGHGAAGEAPPLWRQLWATATVVQAVRRGVSGTVALEQVPAALRPGVQALAYRVWRQAGRAQALRAALVPRAPSAPVDALLCTALALLWDHEQALYEPFTLVNQAVEAAKRHHATRAQASLVNACLRRFLRERTTLIAQTDADPVAVWNHPAWWIGQLQKDYPTQWQALLTAANRHAPMALRVNVRKVSVADYLAQLQSLGMAAERCGESGVLLAEPVPVQRLPGFAVGWVSVQDAAAQIAAPLLLNGWAHGPQHRVLDACAAPGGKTGHLLELTQAAVTALEVDAVRSKRIGENLVRLGLTADVRVADAMQVEAWWDGVPFDAILLDAPCTASGIVRRHPDVRWLRRPGDVAQLAAIQQQMLCTLWPLLKPGGRLLYCTCSVFQAEGAQQVQAFLQYNKEAVLLPAPGHLMPGGTPQGGDLQDNPIRDHDGFFYALFYKQPI